MEAQVPAGAEETEVGMPHSMKAESLPSEKHGV